MAIRRNAAIALAQWILQEHPGLYQHLLRRARPGGLSGLGDVAPADYAASDVTVDYVSQSGVYDPQALREASFNAVVSLPPTTVDMGLNPVAALDPTAVSPIDINADFVTPGTATIEAPPSPAVSTSNNSIASFYGSTIQGLSALANAASAYFKSQQSPSNAAIQSSVLQAQLARVGAGQNPAAISYVRNPVTGQLIPTLQTYNGTFPLSRQGLASLAPAGVTQFLSSYGLYVLGGLALLALLARRG